MFCLYSASFAVGVLAADSGPFSLIFEQIKINDDEDDISATGDGRSIRSFHGIRNVVDRGVLAMWDELAGKVGHHVAVPTSSDPDQILKSLHWLKVYRSASNTKLFLSVIRFYTVFQSTLHSRYHYHPAFPIHSVVVTGHSPSPTSSVESQNH